MGVVLDCCSVFPLLLRLRKLRRRGTPSLGPSMWHTALHWMTWITRSCQPSECLEAEHILVTFFLLLAFLCVCFPLRQRELNFGNMIPKWWDTNRKGRYFKSGNIAGRHLDINSIQKLHIWVSFEWIACSYPALFARTQWKPFKRVYMVTFQTSVNCTPVVLSSYVLMYILVFLSH